MKHRNIDHDRLTPAAIDNIIERGELPDWMPLLKAIASDPFGTISATTLRICNANPVYGASAVFRRYIVEQQSAATNQSEAIMRITPPTPVSLRTPNPARKRNTI